MLFRSEKIVGLMLKDAAISARAIAEKIGINQRSVEKNIKILKNMGIVSRAGSAKSGHWVVME